MKCTPEENHILVVFPDEKHADHRVPRPPQYDTPELCHSWITAAFHCTECENGNNNTLEPHSNPYSSLKVAESCWVCDGRGVVL